MSISNSQKSLNKPMNSRINQKIVSDYFLTVQPNSNNVDHSTQKSKVSSILLISLQENI